MVENNFSFKTDKVENEILKERKDREEYLNKLRKWLDEARLWHYSIYSGFTINLGEGSAENLIYQNSFSDNVPNPRENLQNVLQQRFQFIAQRNYQNPFMHTVGQPSSRVNPPSTYEFVIPPLWKRAVAELVDFLLLLLFKIALTFVLLESFDIIDMGFYGLELFQKNLENSEGTVPMAVELLTLELLHRIIVCIYEAFFLKGKFCATPGKRYMGLMVVSVDTLTPVPGRPNETVSVTRAAPLGWQKSFTRAALKNLFVGLFLPLCIAFYIFPNNRTSYDMMSKSLVVEHHQEFLIYHSPV